MICGPRSWSVCKQWCVGGCSVSLTACPSGTQRSVGARREAARGDDHLCVRWL